MGVVQWTVPAMDAVPMCVAGGHRLCCAWRPFHGLTGLELGSSPLLRRMIMRV